MFPKNEDETISLYRLIQNQTGWHIAQLQTQYPDAIIEKKGQQLKAEFEYQAKNFKAHHHNPEDADLIICWRNDWPESPLPIWALEDFAKEEAKVLGKILKDKVSSFDLRQANQRIEQLEILVDTLQPGSYEWTDEEIELWIGEDTYAAIMWEIAHAEMEKRHGVSLTPGGRGGWIADPAKKSSGLALGSIFVGAILGGVLTVVMTILLSKGGL